MFQNLLDYEPDTVGYIQYFEDPALEKQLAKIGLKRDVEFVKHPFAESDRNVRIELSDEVLVLLKEKAASILVRACEVCWSCGECGIDEPGT